MTDPLLNWYERELEFFRQMGAEFAQSKPKIAARLELSPDEAKDPHVERLIQAFAYLNARIRFKLDDDYPEMTDAMIGILYPHFLQPIPSITTLQFILDEGQADLTAGYHVPRGTTIESERVADESCTFRTTSDVSLYPLSLERVRLQSRPFAVPPSRASRLAEAMLKVELSPFDKSKSLGEYDFDKLRFHIHLSQFHQAAALYELLFDNVLGIVVAGSPDEKEPVVLPREALVAASFEDEDALLPWTARSFPGYRLMTEFFAFPRKFLYFDVEIGRENLSRLGNRLEISILLSTSDPNVEQLVKDDTLRLGCVPIINLFDITCDAVTLSEKNTEYRIIPDARRESAVEVYSVNEVAVGDSAGNQREFSPFYSVNHAEHDHGNDRSFWHATRKPGPTAADFAPSRFGGTEVYVTLVDTAFSPLQMADGTLYTKATCFNRDLPMRLPFGGGRPHFDLPDGRGPIREIRCLSAPTETFRPALGRRNLWRVVSQLSLNHLSIDGSPEATATLREILSVYDLRGTADTRDMIEGIDHVSSRRTVHRVGGVFARGTEISVVFDDEKYTGSSAYLLASLLDRFFGMYTTINSFTRLVATTRRKQSRDERWEWAPRASNRALV